MIIAGVLAITALVNIICWNWSKLTQKTNAGIIATIMLMIMITLIVGMGYGICITMLNFDT